MQDSPLLGQILLGYAPVVGADGQAGSLQLSLMPANSGARLDAAEVLRLLVRAFPEGKKPKAGAPLDVFVNIVSESLLDDLIGLHPPPHFGLELPAFMTSAVDRAGRFRELHERQVSLVAKGWAVSSVPESLLESFRALIVDAADADLGIDRPPSSGPRRLDTYIEGVRTTAEMSRAFSSGARGVVGLPDEQAVPGRKELAFELRVIVELMHLAERKAPFERMLALMQSDTAMGLTFLRLVNAPAFGWRVEAPTFAHAFLLMGPTRLMCWLALLLVWSVPDEHARPWVRMAVRRGLAMSELARAAGQEELQDEMFICGLFSLLDKMTGMAFNDLMALMPMPARVQSSITGSAGPYVLHLSLLAAVEQASFAEITEVADRLMIAQVEVNRAIMSALAAVRSLEA
jgi:EAL and modified HD-GYP domain-containing signal transduction protein